MTHASKLAPRILDKIRNSIQSASDYAQFSQIVDDAACQDKEKNPQLYADLVGDLRQCVYVLALSRGDLPLDMTRKVHIHASELAFQNSGWLRPDYLRFSDGTQIEELEIFLDHGYLYSCMAVAANSEFIRNLFDSCDRVRRLSIVSVHREKGELNLYMTSFFISLVFTCIKTEEVSVGPEWDSESTIILIEDALHWSKRGAETPMCPPRVRLLSFPYIYPESLDSSKSDWQNACALAPLLCRAANRDSEYKVRVEFGAKVEREV